MSFLPDVLGLRSIDENTARKLADRLRAVGVSREALAPYSRIGERLPDPLRRPLRRWHLRRAPSVATAAMRAFFFADPITEAEAEAVLGADLYQTVRASGMLVVRDGGVVCPFLWNLVNELFVVCDDLFLGGDAVMGAGATTGGLAQASFPMTARRRMLDLGCGAGTIALLHAAVVEHVVGVDINPRAIELAQLNARLNGIHNVSFRSGDGFAPVAEERFDLIVSQPPFISQPRSAKHIAFLHGGERGDELCMRFLSEMPAMLAPGGRSVFLIDWPKIGTYPLERQLRDAIGSQGNLLLLVSVPKDLDEYCAHYAYSQGPSVDYTQALLAHREHLAQVGVEELRMVFVVYERDAAAAPWTSTVISRAFMQVDPTGFQVEQIVRARNLAQCDDRTFRRAVLRVPPETRFTEGTDGRVVATLPDRCLVPPVVCGRPSMQLLSFFGEPTIVADAFLRFAQQIGADVAAIEDKLLGAVRDALESGLLELPPEVAS